MGTRVLEYSCRYLLNCKFSTVGCQISGYFGTLIDRFIPSRRGSKVFLFGLTFIYKISIFGIYILVYGYPGIYMSWYIYHVICEYRYIYVLYVWARAKSGRSDAFFFKNSLLGKKKGARHAIKRIELYGVTWPFFGELLLIFCKTRWNVPYRSCPYKM